MRLTATTIRTLSLPEGKVHKVFFDSDLPGFGLRHFSRAGETVARQPTPGAHAAAAILVSAPRPHPAHTLQRRSWFQCFIRCNGIPQRCSSVLTCNRQTLEPHCRHDICIRCKPTHPSPSAC
jgi:hypothetical protein